MSKKVFYFTLSAVLIFSSLAANLALAQTEALNILKEAGTTAVGESEARQMETEGYLGSTAGMVINTLLGLLGLVFLILILYGGFLWMTAAGNEEKVKKATQVIGRATIGLIIIALSYGITYFVLRALVNATTGTTPG